MFNVGDKVSIREGLQLGEFYGDCMYVRGMLQYEGKVATVTEVFDSETSFPNYSLDIDKGKWFWDSRMIESVEEVEHKTCNEKDSTRLAKAVCEYEEIVHNLEQDLHKMTQERDSYKDICHEISERFNSLADKHNELADEYNALVDEYNELADEYNNLI